MNPLVITLQRFKITDYGTLGWLFIDEKLAPLATLEPPGQEFKKRNTCVAPGIYNLTEFHSDKYGQVYKVENVPFRLGILIHVGNVMDDTTGCILVGERFGYVKPLRKKGVLNSRIALGHLRTRLETERTSGHVLRICYASI